MLLKPIQVATPIWVTKHYEWATRFQFLGAQVATKAPKSVCSTVTATEEINFVHYTAAQATVFLN